MQARRSDNDTELEAIKIELVAALYRLAATVDSLAPRSADTGSEGVVSLRNSKPARPSDQPRDAATHLLTVLLDVNERVKAFAREFAIPPVEPLDPGTIDR